MTSQLDNRKAYSINYLEFGKDIALCYETAEQQIKPVTQQFIVNKIILRTGSRYILQHIIRQSSDYTIKKY
jgi:hypothetical protein